MQRDNISITIHEDDPILIEVMGVCLDHIAKFDPVENDMSFRTAQREIVLGNITVRIYEP